MENLNETMVDKAREEAKAHFIESMVGLLKKKLNRGERIVSNKAFNSVKEVYVKERGLKSGNAIIKDFTTIKPAKSVEQLCENIKLGLREGTRCERTDKDLDEIEF